MTCNNNRQSTHATSRWFCVLLFWCAAFITTTLPASDAPQPAAGSTQEKTAADTPEAEDTEQDPEPEIQQTVLLSGTKNVRFSIRAPLKVRKDRAYALVSEAGATYPLKLIGDSPFGPPVFELDAVAPVNATCSLCDRPAGSGSDAAFQTLQRAAVRIIPKFRVLLSFDDGPAIGQDPDDGRVETSPTWKTLQALDAFRHGPDNSRQGIKAVFFVLSQPDRFLRDTYQKAETADGAALLREEIKRGHVVGVHWGGQYVGQTVTHPKRVFLPPYDYTGGKNGGKGMGDNALESDLLECIDRIRTVTGVTPKFLRPPLWRYGDPKNPAAEAAVLGTYARLGLKMILTDARFPDGGYAVISAFIPNSMGSFRKNLRGAFQGGEDTIIVSMHDSNSFTANKLPQILSAICEDFEKERFGNQSGSASEYLDFADSTAEVEAILREKTRFTLFPAYTPPHAPALTQSR